MPNFQVGDKVKLKPSVRLIMDSHNGKAYINDNANKAISHLLNKTAIVIDTEMYYNGTYFNEIYYVDEKTGYYVDADSLIKVKDEEVKQFKNCNMLIEIRNDKVSIQVKDNNHYEVNRFKDETDNEMLERAFQLAKTEYDKLLKANVPQKVFPQNGDIYYKFQTLNNSDSVITYVYNALDFQCLIDKKLDNIAATKEELLTKKETIYTNLYKFLSKQKED